MALTSIALCSRALLKLGADTIAAFDEGTTEAEISANLYSSTRDALLSSHPWSFATAQISLPLLATEPVADYSASFQLPADFLRALSAGTGSRGRGLNYRIAERKLHCNAEAVILTYIFRPAESEYPPFFDQALIARLAAEFCIPLTESTTRSQFLYQQAGNEFRSAKTIDSQQDHPTRFEDFSLVEVRN